MGLFSKFKKNKDASVNSDTPKSVEAKKSEEPAKKAPAEEVKKTAPKTEKKAAATVDDVKKASTKAEKKPAPVVDAKKAEASKAEKAKKADAPTASPANKTSADDTKKTEKKPGATVSKTAKTKKEEAPVEAPTDDASADLIATDESAEVVKEKGLSGFFEIKKSKDGRFVFNLFASNRVIIATSQVYSSSASALNGANSVIANAERAAIEDNTLKNPTPVPFPKWEIYRDKAEKYRFRLFAPNGSCICHSQGYTSKASCKNGIESIIRTVKDANIDKSYLKKDKKNND